MLVPISDTDKVDGGIRIKIEIPNKHITSLHMLSGGEKSLVSLSLALSLSKVIDAPFFIFDEIDAALDSENINKIFSIIKQLSSSRQIIAISHNEVSASYADALIGVTMVKGESKCFSIERKEEVSKLLNTT
jgi:chromosome segregation protein